MKIKLGKSEDEKDSIQGPGRIIEETVKIIDLREKFEVLCPVNQL